MTFLGTSDHFVVESGPFYSTNYQILFGIFSEKVHFAIYAAQKGPLFTDLLRKMGHFRVEKVHFAGLPP